MGNEQEKEKDVDQQDIDMEKNNGTDIIPIDSTEKIEEKKKDEEKKVERWCSWCWGRTIHQMKRKGWLLERSTYECTGCNNETTKCIFCPTAMTRSYGHVADNLCLKCDGTFYNSGKKISRTDKGNFYCSWCFEKTNHTLFDKSLLGRDVYKCINCHKTGSNCRSCSTALARDHGTTSDLYCIVCDGTLKSWELEDIEKISENKNITLKKINCGWCIESTDHILKQKNVLRRNTYCCEKCRNDNVLCVSCSRAMATCGVLVDSKLCMYCKKEQKLSFEEFWFELRKKKKEILPT